MEELEELLSGNGNITNDPKPPIDINEFKALEPKGIGNVVQWEGNKDVGQSGYGDSQWDKGATLQQIEEGRLGEQRAELQPWTDQLGNMLGQAVVGEIVGGTVEGLGYLLDVGSMADYITGQETEWGNFLTEAGQSLREGAQDEMAIYEEKPGEMNMSDPGYWFKNGVSVASSLSMLVPSMAATKALGFLGKAASKGAGMLGKAAKIKKELDIAKGLSTKALWMTEGVSQAVVSRHIENSMEAHGTFEDQKQKLLKELNKKTGKMYTEEEATMAASEAAAYNYRHGWAMLLQDIPQYLALGRVFNPVSMKMENALSKAAGKGIKPKWQSTLQAGGGTFLSEGFEEGYQFYIAEKGKLLSDLKAGLITEEEYSEEISKAMGSDEAMTSMLFGGLGGNLFQMAGKGVNATFKSKSRKELESKAAENYNAGLKQRAMQIAVMQDQLYKADQTQNEEFRQDALNNLMTQTIIEAINNDKLDSAIETLTKGPKMTEEEIAVMERDHKVEYNPELAKKYTPQILDNVNRIKKMHYKNLNNGKYKKLDKNIISAITMNQFQTEESLNSIEKLNKSYEEDLNKSTFTALNPSNYTDRKSRLTVNRDALQEAIDFTKQRIAATKNPAKKSQYEKAVKRSEAKLAEFEKDLKEVEELKKDRTATEKLNDADSATAWDNIKDDLVKNRTNKILLEDFISSNQEDIKRMSNPNYEKEFNKKAILATAKMAKTQEEIEDSIADVETIPDLPDPQKKEIIDELKASLKKIKDKARMQKARDAKAEYKRLKELEIEAANANPAKPDSNANVTVTEAIEDEHAGEEIDFETKQEESDKASEEIDLKGAKTISLLDTAEKTKAYQEWKHDGTPKVGTKVTYAISTNAERYRTPAQQTLVTKFNKAVKDGTPIPQEVYDDLAIAAFMGDGKKIFTYMPSKGGKFGEVLDTFNEVALPERIAIIDALAADQTPTTEILHTSGGKLMTETDENGLPAENSVMALRQISGDMNKVVLTYSDENGKLVDVATKELNREFDGKQIQVADGMPYRGGLFLVLNKADGTKFPVRMNFQKNTAEQAETIADILIEIAVPNEKGTEKNIKFNQPLSTIDEGLKSRIKEVMGPELSVLGKDPKMGDIVNMFVYVSEKTKGLKSNLHWSGEFLNYGDKNSITPSNRGSQTERGKLVDFLQNVKRRQFSLKFWNDPKIGPAYRKFVLESGVINTNVVTGDSNPEFQTDLESTFTDKNGMERPYRIQMYVKPLENTLGDPVVQTPVVKPTPKNKDGVIYAPEIQARIDKTLQEGILVDEDGSSYVNVYKYRFKAERPFAFPTMEAAMAEYEKENAKLQKAKPAAKSTVIPNNLPVDPISNEVYDDFIDNGTVSDKTIQDIAYKVKDNKELSPRETAIFTDKTTEVNNKLKDIAKDAKIAPPSQSASNKTTKKKRRPNMPIDFGVDDNSSTNFEKPNEPVSDFDKDQPAKINKKCKD